MYPKLYPVGSVKRYSAKNVVVAVNFFFAAPHAKMVSLIGDFNDWHPNAHPMKRQPDGSWRLQVELHAGHHHYQFLVDGKPMLDPRAQGIARNERHEKVSLISVS